jgi:hypothetical protein
MAEVDILLDTDILIEILRGTSEADAWLTQNADKAMGLPVFVYMEALLGARSNKEFAELKARLKEFTLVEPASNDTPTSLHWFERYRVSRGVGILDCYVGAVAVRLSVPLYTFNLKHYRNFDGLDVREPYKRHRK